MLGYDCHSPLSVSSARRSFTDTLFVPYVRVLSSSALPLSNDCVNARPAWSPGTPLPAYLQGNKWLSQVPRLPLCLHAPLFDPGGVRSTRLVVLRTAASHLHESVGFPARLLAVILCPQLYKFRGSITRPASSLPLASDPRCRFCPQGSLPACWLDFGWVGFFTHWVTSTNFYSHTPMSHRSGLRLARHALVRPFLGAEEPMIGLPYL
jgi:hypothetical protein